MLKALALLLSYQLAGEIAVRLLGIPVPGPVVGMALLFLWLGWRGRVDDPLRGTALGILENLSLLFVPAGVGIMVHFGRVADEWLALAFALVASTLLSVAATALTLAWFIKRGGRS